MKMIAGADASVITQLVTRPDGTSIPFLRGYNCPGSGGVIETAERALRIRGGLIFFERERGRGEWVSVEGS